MPARRAVLIGVETCPAADCWGAGNDVRAIGSVVCPMFGLTPEVLPNRAATRDGILAVLDSVVRASQRGDVVLLYFAGHGTRVPSRRGDGSVHEALCPHDFDLDRPETAIADHELHERFSKFDDRSVRLTAVFDCCFSGGIPEGEATRGTPSRVRGIASRASDETLRGGSPSVVHRIAEFEVLRDDGSIVVFSACPADSLAREHQFDKQVRGVFTHHLVEVLQRHLPGITNGCVRDAVEAAVLDDKGLAGYTQTPLIFPAAAKRQIFLGPILET